MREEPKLRCSRFEHFLLRYGAGSHIFHPITRSRLWNRISWTLIGVGIVGWMFFLWLLRD